MSPRTKTVTSLQVVGPRSLGDLLHETRTKKRETQAMVAERFPGITQQLVGKWERNEAVPPENHHQALAEYLGVRTAGEFAAMIDAASEARASNRRTGPRVTSAQGSSANGANSGSEALAKVAEVLTAKLAVGPLSTQEMDILEMAIAALAGIAPSRSAGR